MSLCTSRLDSFKYEENKMCGGLFGRLLKPFRKRSNIVPLSVAVASTALTTINICIIGSDIN